MSVTSTGASTTAISDLMSSMYTKSASASSKTAAGSGSGAGSVSADTDKFMTLLVAQLQNQDPLNPMDNAQVTSQMAQINTVSGIDKLNTTVQGLQSQFVQMQALQGATLVGHDVVVAGNKLDFSDGAGGTGTSGMGGFELTSPADAVKVEITNAAGRVVDTVQMGAATTGRHSFAWDASKFGTDTNVTFKVTATSGATTLSSTALMRDKVLAVSTAGDKLTLDLARNGATAYADIKEFN
jgi:flagellar basal-body rod modification protein FlgD